jgi:hypothetical protein
VKVLLFVIVERVARGRALIANVAGEHGHHVVGLYVPRHIVPPIEKKLKNVTPLIRLSINVTTQ